MSFCSWLTLLFVHHKLTGQIDWSWAWVTAPFWGQSVAVGFIKAIAKRTKLK